MKLYKRMVILSFTFILALQGSTANFVYADTLSVGNAATYNYTAPTMRGGQDSSQATYADTNRSDVGNVSEPWNTSDTERVYRDWERYRIDQDDDFLNNGDSDWGHNGAYGYFPSATNYRIPIGNIRDYIDSLHGMYPDTYNPFYWTMFNGSSPIYTGMPTNNSFTMGARDFFGLDGSGNFFKIGNNSYSDLPSMYAAANDGEKEVIEDLLREALEEADIYTEDEIDDIIDQLRTAAQNAVARIIEGINAWLRKLLLDKFNSLSDLEKAQLLARYYELHGRETQAGFDYGDFDQQLFWDWPWDPFYTLNTMFDPNSYTVNPDGSITYHDIYDSYYDSIGRSNDLISFSNEIIDGGVLDSPWMSYRYGLAEYVLQAYENCGIEWVDVTKVLDYRVKSLWISASEKDTLANRYVWTIEKKDGDGRFTMMSKTDPIANTRYSFRPTSAGIYRITCYPEYVSTSVNKIAMYASEYTYLTDTRNVLFSEQNFQRNGNGESDTVSSMDGNSHKMVDEVVETGDVYHPWNENGTLSNSTNASDPYYDNPYAEVWLVDVDEAMVDHTIIDLDNGTIRADFDTERIR